MSKRVLVMYGSIGLGHKVVAENIAAALLRHSDVELRLLDVLEMYRGPFTETSAKIYEWILARIPWLWGFFYTNRIFHALTLPLRIPFAALKLAKFRAYFRDARPDLILTTHPTATSLVVALKQRGEYQGPLITTFSDFHFQPFWVYPLVDHYLVMTEEQKREVLERGFTEQQITVTGLPVDPQFAKDYDQADIYKSYQLSHTKPIVLLMGGSRGWGIKLADVEALLGSSLVFQLVVVSGLNPQLATQLEQLAQAHPEALKVFGAWSSTEVAKLYAVAKILVTKPGGLSVAQALLRGLPMVLVNPLPTMEEMNLAYLTSRGAAVYAKTSADLRAWVERLLQDKKFYQQVRDQTRVLGTPWAAESAVKVIIDRLNSRG